MKWQRKRIVEFKQILGGIGLVILLMIYYCLVTRKPFNWIQSIFMHGMAKEAYWVI